jgi:hypothetical protein
MPHNIALQGSPKQRRCALLFAAPQTRASPHFNVRTEARFACGTRSGPRSTIWKAWVHGDEAYISSRMFGSDMKASFHSSGQCQWSATDTWVRRQAGVRNAERHVHRWHVDYPDGNDSLLVFRVQIPASELRALPSPRDRKKVWWVSGIPEGATARFLFYITRPSDVDPGLAAPTSLRYLFSLRLRSARWLVAFVELISLSDADIESARAAVLTEVKSLGLVPSTDHRMCLFSQPPAEGGPHGLLELCLTEAQQRDAPDRQVIANVGL